MMATVTDARISTTWPSHPKTRKLRRRLGPGGPLGFIYLLAYAAANRTDGDLTGMSDEDIELAADWDGAPGEFVTAAAEAGFLDGEAGAYRLHDWADHQPWANGAEERSQKGRFAVLCRDYGRKRAMEMMPGYAAKLRGDTGKASASNQADDLVDHPDDRVRSSPTPIPTPTPIPSPNQQQGEQARKPARTSVVTFSTWMERLAEGEQAIPPDDPVFQFAEDAGIPEDMLTLAWAWFERTYTGSRKAKRYADWRKVFRNAVEGNWPKVWRLQEGAYVLTSEGEMLRRAIAAEKRRASA